MDPEKNKTGAKGKDLVIQVPVGTVILTEDKKSIIKDFSSEFESFTFLKGGGGGRGNSKFKSSTKSSTKKI